MAGKARAEEKKRLDRGVIVDRKGVQHKGNKKTMSRLGLFGGGKMELSKEKEERPAKNKRELMRRKP